MHRERNILRISAKFANSKEIYWSEWSFQNMKKYASSKDFFFFDILWIFGKFSESLSKLQASSEKNREAWRSQVPELWVSSANFKKVLITSKQIMALYIRSDMLKEIHWASWSCAEISWSTPNCYAVCWTSLNFNTLLWSGLKFVEGFWNVLNICKVLWNSRCFSELLCISLKPEFWDCL